MLVKNQIKINIKIWKISQVRKLLLRKGTDQEKIAHNEIKDSQVSSLNRLPESILALKSGKVVGTIVEKPVGEAYLKQNPELEFADVKFNEEKKPTCIAVPKNSPIY